MGSPGERPRLLFVAPWFLFPNDSGGKIRTTQILRGMKGGAFEIALASPEPMGGSARFSVDLDTVCDRYASWPEAVRGPLHRFTRMRLLLSRLPIPVATDRSRAGRALVAAELARAPDVVVFDFAHAAVLAPRRFGTRSVLFTHNVEAEIFRRHAAKQGQGRLRGAIWRNQYRKMVAFEKEACNRFDEVVAVSERDGEFFSREYGCPHVSVIPTGVDLDHYRYSEPGAEPLVVYVGSMDSEANIDAMRHFMDDVWPLIVAERPEARMRVVGKKPPPSLVRRAASLHENWEFTGFVDDVREHVEGAAVHAVPLRVGGGTRIKVYEGLAMGPAMVSTAIGVEGLDLEAGEHYLEANTAREMAAAVLRLLADADLRLRVSRRAREHVEARYGSAVVAEAFESICLKLLKREPRRRARR